MNNEFEYSSYISNGNQDVIVDALLASIKLENASAAIWSLPSCEGFNIIVDLSPPDEESGFDLTVNKDCGFIVNPFFGQRKNFSWIRPGVEFIFKEDAKVGYEIRWNDGLDENRKKQFSDAFEYCLSKRINQRHTQSLSCDQWSLDQRQEKKNFLHAVEEAIARIRQPTDILAKVVVARKRYVSLPTPIPWSLIFRALKHIYPRTLVSLTSTPRFGTWLGASPEILLSVNEKSIATTDSLAGTRKKNIRKKREYQGQDSIWRNKERYEQSLVTVFITQALAASGITVYEKTGPVTCNMGDLIHLREIFRFDLDCLENRIASLENLIYELHPTSAVCGLPKQPALEFISKKEKLNRTLYAGFLGPVNFHNALYLYVNIRCMQLLTDGALIYAGAGITADSDPLAEWEETEAKCSILSVIFSDKSLEESQ